MFVLFLCVFFLPFLDNDSVNKNKFKRIPKYRRFAPYKMYIQIKYEYNSHLFGTLNLRNNSGFIWQCGSKTNCQQLSSITYFRNECEKNNVVDLIWQQHRILLSGFLYNTKIKRSLSDLLDFVDIIRLRSVHYSRQKGIPA